MMRLYQKLKFSVQFSSWSGTGFTVRGKQIVLTSRLILPFVARGIVSESSRRNTELLPVLVLALAFSVYHDFAREYLVLDQIQEL
jgi:hypothetical protein